MLKSEWGVRVKTAWRNKTQNLWLQCVAFGGFLDKTWGGTCGKVQTVVEFQFFSFQEKKILEPEATPKRSLQRWIMIEARKEFDDRLYHLAAWIYGFLTLIETSSKREPNNSSAVRQRRVAITRKYNKTGARRFRHMTSARQTTRNYHGKRVTRRLTKSLSSMKLFFVLFCASILISLRQIGSQRRRSRSIKQREEIFLFFSFSLCFTISHFRVLWWRESVWNARGSCISVLCAFARATPPLPATSKAKRT